MDMDCHLVTLSASLSLSSIGLADRGALRKAGEFCRAPTTWRLGFLGWCEPGSWREVRGPLCYQARFGQRSVTRLRLRQNEIDWPAWPQGLPTPARIRDCFLSPDGTVVRPLRHGPADQRGCLNCFVLPRSAGSAKLRF